MRRTVLVNAVPSVASLVRRLEGPDAPFDPLSLVEEVKPLVEAVAGVESLRKVLLLCLVVHTGRVEGTRAGTNGKWQTRHALPPQRAGARGQATGTPVCDLVRET